MSWNLILYLWEPCSMQLQKISLFFQLSRLKHIPGYAQKIYKISRKLFYNSDICRDSTQVYTRSLAIASINFDQFKLVSSPCELEAMSWSSRDRQFHLVNQRGVNHIVCPSHYLNLIEELTSPPCNHSHLVESWLLHGGEEKSLNAFINSLSGKSVEGFLSILTPERECHLNCGFIGRNYSPIAISTLSNVSSTSQRVCSCCVQRAFYGSVWHWKGQGLVRKCHSAGICCTVWIVPFHTKYSLLIVPELLRAPPCPMLYGAAPCRGFDGADYLSFWFIVVGIAGGLTVTCAL